MRGVRQETKDELFQEETRRRIYELLGIGVRKLRWSNQLRSTEHGTEYRLSITCTGRMENEVDAHLQLDRLIDCHIVGRWYDEEEDTSRTRISTGRTGQNVMTRIVQATVRSTEHPSTLLSVLGAK
jgi:hypothetical protein